MSAFIQDRDLLLIDPYVFRDATPQTQRLVTGEGTLTGSTLSLSLFDTSPGDAAVTAGHVALVNLAAYEVMSRPSPTQLTLSRLRARTTDPGVPPPPGTNVQVVVSTMMHQIELAHRQILWLLGIDPDAAAAPGILTEASILNPGALKLAETLLSLHLICAAASSTTGPDSTLARKAERYWERFDRERQTAAALIDGDGDGRAESIRRLSGMQLLRTN
jgi:hypothetical protein